MDASSSRHNRKKQEIAPMGRSYGPAVNLPEPANVLCEVCRFDPCRFVATGNSLERIGAWITPDSTNSAAVCSDAASQAMRHRGDNLHQSP